MAPVQTVPRVRLSGAPGWQEDRFPLAPVGGDAPHGRERFGLHRAVCWIALLSVIQLQPSPVAARSRPDLELLYQGAVLKIRTAINRGLPPSDHTWREAIGDLEEAVRIDPLPKRRKFGRSTAFREPYSPYLFLGVAFLHAGDRQRARQHLQEALTYQQVDPRDRPMLQYLADSLNTLRGPPVGTDVGLESGANLLATLFRAPGSFVGPGAD